jgi:uncharacterized protein YutE (UPF0331/DUF86 family)
VLHGSRARGEARPNADWDVGVVAEGLPDLPLLTAELAAILGTDAVDVVDLRTASALLRFRAARDGVVLLERPAGAFEDCQLEAARFWCDAGPVIRAAQEDVLAELSITGIDRELLAERAASVLRHLDRVATHLPAAPADLTPSSTATDSVVLHLWQAVQVVIDLAVSTCVRLGLGSPPTYADAFRRLSAAGVLDEGVAARLAAAAGFRNLVVHAYADLDLQRVHAIATSGPADLRAFLAALCDHTA